jgi:ribonuclease R
LKSLTRAEYSPRPLGHYALASEQYCHFTSPIRRYADLTIHRLLDEYLKARGNVKTKGKKKKKIVLQDAPTYDELVELGRHISFTERRAEDAERELRQVKILTLLSERLGEEFKGVITGITNFGVFIQIQTYLVDGLIRYEHLLDDWWDVDERTGSVRGQRTGIRLGIGDVVKVVVARVDLPRRELSLSITQLPNGQSPAEADAAPKGKGKPAKGRSGNARPAAGNRRQRQPAGRRR